MRICIFTPNFLPAIGGAELVTDALARELHAQGHHVVVLARGKPAPLDVPYPVHWFARPTFPRLFPERVGRAVARLHARERFDIFAANYAQPTGYAALRLGSRIGVPTVITSHGGDLYHTSNHRGCPHLWRRTLYAYQHADGLVAISPYIEGLIREINPRPAPLARIPNGIDAADLARPAQRPADFKDVRPFCLCLGNLGPMKGFCDAIAAYAQVRRRLGGRALVIVGNGPLGPALQRQAQELQLNGDVFFAGHRTGNDKRWFLQNACFGLMPSREEGHPLVALEFLANGKPAICSTNPAFDGTYDDGVNAMRVPAQRPDLLGDAMVRMAGADLAEMGRQSRRRAGGYAWRSIAARYVDFFRSVLAARDSPKAARPALQRPAWGHHL